LLVLLTVALLLQGPVGVFEALRDYTVKLIGTLFGGEDVYREVLCQAAPLTLALAMISFSYRCGWLSFAAPTSLVAAGALVLGSTWIGGEWRSSLSQQSIAAATRAADASVDKISVPEAIAKLSDLRTVATDGSHHRWDQRVPRVEALPEARSAIGIIGRAINQLLGYFVIYRPRLFFAAVLLGTYIGWSWQPCYQAIDGWVRRERGVEPAGRPRSCTQRPGDLPSAEQDGTIGRCRLFTQEPL
jgi:hypothetical protein